MKKFTLLTLALFSIVVARSLMAEPCLSTSVYSEGVTLTWSVLSDQIDHDGLEQYVNYMVTVTNNTSHELSSVKVFLSHNQEEVKMVAGGNFSSAALDGSAVLEYGTVVSCGESARLFYSAILPAGIEIKAPQLSFSSPDLREDAFSGISW